MHAICTPPDNGALSIQLIPTSQLAGYGADREDAISQINETGLIKEVIVDFRAETHMEHMVIGT